VLFLHTRWYVFGAIEHDDVIAVSDLEPYARVTLTTVSRLKGKDNVRLTVGNTTPL